MKTIGIVGSRRRNDQADFLKVKEAFCSAYREGDRLVSGGCFKGADRFCEMLAKEYQIPITIHYAAWRLHGLAAGFIRNGDIAAQADVLIACVAPDRRGGTEDTIKKYTALGKDKLILV